MKNIKRYLILLMALVICDYVTAQFIIAGDTNAPDILYKSINKTISVTGPAPGQGHGSNELDYEFDVDDQGLYDFVFTVSAGATIFGPWSYCILRSAGENQFCVTTLPFLNNDTSYVKPFNFADTIGINNLWYTSTTQTVLAWFDYSKPSPSFGGIWDSLPYKYLGIRVKIGEIYYYGWIQMKVRVSGIGGAPEANIYLKNSAIIKSTFGINDEDKTERYRIYPNPVNDKLTIEPLSSATGGVLILYNNNSQPLITKELTNVKTELDLGRYARGLYHLLIKTGNKVAVKKIIIE
jgi:hypothetical protein